jgi:hypothetical protein
MTDEHAPSSIEVGATMWKGHSDALELSDTVDPTRTDLFDRFLAAPFARHDLELQLLISSVRGSARIPRIVLSQVSEHRWVVTQIAAERGARPELVTPREFDDLEDAERFVFEYRLRLLHRIEADR